MVLYCSAIHKTFLIKFTNKAVVNQYVLLIVCIKNI